MSCRMGELRNKEVINVKDGTIIVFVCDVEIDTHTAVLTAVVVYGRLRLFGLLGREEDFVIPWQDIVLIGDDAVLVNFEEKDEKENKGFFTSLLDKLCF